MTDGDDPEKIDDIKLVPEPAKESLNKRRLVDYRSQRAHSSSNGHSTSGKSRNTQKATRTKQSGKDHTGLTVPSIPPTSDV